MYTKLCKNILTDFNLRCMIRKIFQWGGTMMFYDFCVMMNDQNQSVNDVMNPSGGLTLLYSFSGK